MRQSERGVLVGIVLAIAAVLRIAFAASVRVQAGPGSDSGQYQQYAKNLLEHGVFSLSTSTPPLPDSFRSPGYPWFLAACRWLGGDTHFATVAVGLQVLLGVLTVLATYRIVRRFGGFWTALVAALGVALSPHLVTACTFLLTECVTGAVLIAGSWLLLGAAGRGRWLAAGGAFGALLLCNEALLPVVALLAIVSLRANGRVAVWWIAPALLPFMLWTARNQMTPLELRGGQRVVASISHGSYPGMVYGGDPRTFGFPYRADPEQPSFGSSWSELWRVGAPRVAAEPVRHALWYFVQKPVWLWSWPLVQGDDVMVYAIGENPYERHAAMAVVHWLMRMLHAPCMVLAALAVAWCLVSARRAGRGRLAWLAVVLVGTTLAYLPVIPDPRYFQPVRPLAFAFAALGVAAVVRAVRVRGARVALA